MVGRVKTPSCRLVIRGFVLELVTLLENVSY